MHRETRQLIRLIVRLIKTKNSFFFWFFIRFISTFLPLISVYLFSIIIRQLENGLPVNQIIFTLISLLFVYLSDNFTRLLSIHKLGYIISNTEFGIHQFLLAGVNTQDKKVRHETVQTVRNFSEAVRTTLEIIRQPGLDSLVSLFTIPLLLYFLDFKVFILALAYIAVYLFTDQYTTEKYVALKDIQNAKTEVYFAKLQDSNDVKTEDHQYQHQFQKLCSWNFLEWFTLQNIAVIFYSLVFLYLIFKTTHQLDQISDVVLIMSYIALIQTHLNSISNIKDRLADTEVALERLSNCRDCLSVDLSDLMR